MPWVEEIMDGPPLAEQPQSRSNDPYVLAQRKQRVAEAAPSARRFADAERIFREVLEDLPHLKDYSGWLYNARAHVLTGLRFACAAQERPLDARD